MAASMNILYHHKTNDFGVFRVIAEREVYQFVQSCEGGFMS